MTDDIFENVAWLCRKNKLSIARLERECGFGNATIRGWQKAVPRVDKLKTVADYFGVSLDWIIANHWRE